MTLKVKGEGLGAQVTGVDPKNLDDITTDEIRDIVYTNKLVVLKTSIRLRGSSSNSAG